MLFKFQWHIEMLPIDTHLDPELSSTLLLNKIKRLHNYAINYYKYKNRKFMEMFI